MTTIQHIAEYDPIPTVVVDCENCVLQDTIRCDDGDSCPSHVVSKVCDLATTPPARS